VSLSYFASEKTVATFIEQLAWGPTVGQEILEHYPLNNYTFPWEGAVQIYGDALMSCPARRTARWLTQAGMDVYLYFYTHVYEEIQLTDPFLGVFHGSELFLVFDIADGYYGGPNLIVMTPGERKLSLRVEKYWTNMARTGNPNSGVSNPPLWPNYQNSSDLHLNINLDIEVGSGLKKDLCDFWDSINDELGGVSPLKLLRKKAW